MQRTLSTEEVDELLHGSRSFLCIHIIPKDRRVNIAIERCNHIVQERNEVRWICPDHILELPELLIKWLGAVIGRGRDEHHLAK